MNVFCLQAIEFGQYEEAFEIYKKFGKKVEAIQVLLQNLQDLDRAHDYANKVCQGQNAGSSWRRAASAGVCGSSAPRQLVYILSSLSTFSTAACLVVESVL
jgi:uncharacterized protein (DUF488 family)